MGRAADCGLEWDGCVGLGGRVDGVKDCRAGKDGKCVGKGTVDGIL